MHRGQVPRRVTHRDARQVAVAVRHLETAARDRHRRVAAPQGAALGARERQPQRRTVGSRAQYLRTGQPARRRRLGDLGVPRAVVFQFHPRLRGLVEQRQAQVLDAFEHRQQPPLDLCPERLLLAVLVGAVRQRGLVHDAQPGEPLDDLCGRHRPAVVTHPRPRQAALLNRLPQRVGGVLGVLRQVPLQVAGQPRTIVQHPEQQRLRPLAPRGHDLPRPVMVVPVPQPADVLGLVAAHLARGQPLLGALRAGGAPCAAGPPLAA